MDKEKALKIISLIANGEDPYGTTDSITQPPELHPVTIRALCVAITSLIDNKSMSALLEHPTTFNFTELFADLSGPLKQHFIKHERRFFLSVLQEENYEMAVVAQRLQMSEEDFAMYMDTIGITEKEIKQGAIDVVVKEDYPRYVLKCGIDDYLKTVEKNALKIALENTEFNKSQAADVLGCTFRSFRYRLDKLFKTESPEKYSIRKNISVDYFTLAEEAPLDLFLEIIERKILNKALQDSEGNQSMAADLLRVSFRSFRYRLAKKNEHENGLDNQ